MTPTRLAQIAEVFAVALAERLGRSDSDLRILRSSSALDGELIAIRSAADAFVRARFLKEPLPADLPWLHELEALALIIQPIEVPSGPV